MSRILVPDPAKRLRVADIQRHVWYKKDLPPGVSGMNDHLPPPSPTAQVPSFRGNISLDCCRWSSWLQHQTIFHFKSKISITDFVIWALMECTSIAERGGDHPYCERVADKDNGSVQLGQ